jgi:two-component system LytT family response regulator
MSGNRASKTGVFIVDDEPPARRKLRRFLGEASDFEVIGEAGDGPTAMAAIEELHPDVVFLDIQMPGADGFEVIASLGTVRPHIVFVTAYQEHAVKAFEVEAVDYLLKPFDKQRFDRALARVGDRLRRREPGVTPERLSRLVREIGGGIDRILVKAGDRSFFVRTEEIDWVEAADNYVQLHTSRGGHLVRGTLGGLEERLDPSRFTRISRSVLVNLDRVAEIRPWSHGDRRVILRDGTELMLSRRYRKRLPELFDPEY